jgi:hypothetical protein
MRSKQVIAVSNPAITPEQARTARVKVWLFVFERFHSCTSEEGGVGAALNDGIERSEHVPATDIISE